MGPGRPPLAPGPVFGAIGVCAGALGGLLGVGGGFVLVPLQVVFGRMPQHRATATSLAAILPGSVVGVLVYAFAARRPEVDLRFAALLVVGSTIGAYLGARVVARIPERRLKAAFSILLAGLALKELLSP